MSISLDPPLDIDHGDTTVWPSSTEVLDADVLMAIAAGLAEVSTPWDLRPGEHPDQRHFERTLVTPLYEAWLIYWPPGTALELHDHGDSAGAFAVVAGRLDEVRIVHGAPRAQSLEAGEVSSFTAGLVHGVHNRGAGGATSVHVYSPPISEMNYYVQGADGSFLSLHRDRGVRDTTS